MLKFKVGFRKTKEEVSKVSMPLFISWTSDTRAYPHKLPCSLMGILASISCTLSLCQSLFQDNLFSCS